MRHNAGAYVLLLSVFLYIFTAEQVAALSHFGDSDSGRPVAERGEDRDIERWQLRNGYESDEIFIMTSGYDLDQYLYHEDGPLEFDIFIDRIYSKDNSDWGNIIKDARLVLKVWDVDESGACDGDPLMPERDYVYINDHLCERDGSPKYLTGADDTWSVWTFDIPVEWFENGWIKTATYSPFQSPVPGVNHIRIDIDMVTQHCWAVECDWGKFEIVGTRPSLLVHGMNSNAGTWSQFTPNVNGELYSLASVGGKSGISANSIKVGEQFDQMLTRFGVDHANIIAHSKGGLDSRQFITGDQRVDAFVTIGTPNRGTEYADHATSAHPGIANALCGQAIWDLITWSVEAFNGVNPKNPNAYYYSIGGDHYSAQETTCDVWWCSHQIFTERNDRRVPVNRAPFHWQVSVDEMEDWEHSELIHEAAEHIYSQHIRDWLDAPSRLSGLRGHELAHSANSRPSNQNEHRTNLSEQMTPFTELLVTSEAPVDSILLLDYCYQATFSAVAEAEIGFTLRAPDGTVINPSYATSNENAQYDVEVSSWFGHWYRYVINEPEVGNWHVLLSSADSSMVVTGAVLESNLIVEATVDSVQQSLGDPVTIQASISNGGTPVTNAIPEALFSRADGYEETFSMFHVGAGVYRAECALQRSGHYGVLVNVSGTARAPFRRQAIVRTTITPTSASIASVSAGSGQDTNGSGLYDRIVFPLSLSVTAAPDSFQIQGLLKTPQGTLAGCASTRIHCNTSGNYQISLAFDGEPIYGLHEDGPYELTNLILSEIGGSALIVEESGLNEYTPAYAYTAFERSAITFTQASQEEVIDFDSNGFYDALFITVGVDLVSAGSYQWNGRLDDKYGEQIAWASSSGYLSTGQDSITLEFDGLNICAHGVNGPYYLHDLYVYAGTGYGVDAIAYIAHETSAYDFTEFEHGPMDLVLQQHSLSCSPSAPYIGELVTLSATIVNVGEDCSDEILVQFSAAVGYRNDIIGESLFNGLSFGESVTAEIAWIAPQTPAEYSLTVAADPENSIAENDENNNEGEIRFEVMDRNQTEKVMVDGVIRPGDATCYILFDLERASSTLVLIYDLRGRKIKTVMDDSLPEGRATLSWNMTDDNGRPVVSGTYVCYIKVEGKTYSRKIAVLR
jgi:hypothetical protein